MSMKMSEKRFLHWNLLKRFKNYELFTYTKSPVITKYKRWKSDEIINDYFNINTYLSLRKGEIVYFRLDSDLFDDYMTVGNMITNLTENYVENGYIHRFDSKTNLYVPIKKKLGYSVVTLNELQEIDAINSKRYSLKKWLKRSTTENSKRSRCYTSKKLYWKYLCGFTWI